MIGPVPGLPMVGPGPTDGQATAPPEPTPEGEGGGFAGLVWDATDRSEAEAPVAICVICPMPMLVFDHEALKRGAATAVEIDAAGQCEPVQTIVESAGHLMPSEGGPVLPPAVAPPPHLDASLIWTEQGQDESPVALTVPAASGQVLPQTAELTASSMAPDLAWAPIKKTVPPDLADAKPGPGSGVVPAIPVPRWGPDEDTTPAPLKAAVSAGRAADSALDEVPVPLPGLPQPVVKEREAIRPLLAAVDEAPEFGLLGPDPNSSADRVAAMAMRGDPAYPRTALLLRFQSEGRAIKVSPSAADSMRVPVWPLRSPDARIVTVHPAVATYPTPPDQPTEGPTVALPTTPLGPPPAGMMLKEVSALKDKDPEPDLAVTTSVGGQMPNGKGPVAAGEGPKPVASNLSQLAAPILDVLAKGADGTTTLTLSPEELGKVRLSFRPDTQNSDRMVVMLAFDRPETMELFRRHADQLSEALRGAGYAAVQIGFGGAGDGNSHRPTDRSETPESKAEVAPQDDAFPVPPSLRTGTLGGLDLRL